MGFYYVNKNQTCNPGLHHEVHTEEHAIWLGISSKINLGCCLNAIDAVAKAKAYYYDADGCAMCCPRAHKG